MKSDREKDIAAVAPVLIPDFEVKSAEAEVLDAAKIQQLEAKPVQAPVTAWTAKGALKAARLNADIIEEDKRAAELELGITKVEAEAVKLRAETFALLKQVAVRVQHMRREMEELVTQIEIEVKTRKDRVLAAKANAARERVLATHQYRMARYDALLARIEARMRVTSALENSRNDRVRKSETEQPGADAQRNLAAWAELVAVEAAEGNLENAPVSPYGEFAAYHYVCARLRGNAWRCDRVHRAHRDPPEHGEAHREG